MNKLVEAGARPVEGLEAFQGTVLKVDHIRRVNVSEDWHGTFRAAGVTYVDPNGRILLYASDHSGDTFGADEMAIDEWRTNPFTTD